MVSLYVMDIRYNQGSKNTLAIDDSNRVSLVIEGDTVYELFASKRIMIGRRR